VLRLHACDQDTSWARLGGRCRRLLPDLPHTAPTPATTLVTVRPHIQTHRHWHKDTGTDTQTHKDTQTHRQTDTQTHRHTDTQTSRHTDTQTRRHTDTETQRHRDTQTRSVHNVFFYQHKAHGTTVLRGRFTPLHPPPDPDKHRDAATCSHSSWSTTPCVSTSCMKRCATSNSPRSGHTCLCSSAKSPKSIRPW